MNAEFIDHVIELLAPLGRVGVRRMFGGAGVYIDETMVAIVFDDALYLKVDDSTRAAFEAEGSRPFVYRDAKQEITMTYWSAPEESLDSSDAMAPWARRAIAAASRKPPRKGKARAPAAKASRR